MKKRYIFILLFALSVVYHVWSFINFGFDAFRIIGFPLQTKTIPFELVEIILIVFLNILNYSIQVGLPILFFYLGFVKKYKK